MRQATDAIKVYGYMVRSNSCDDNGNGKRTSIDKSDDNNGNGQRTSIDTSGSLNPRPRAYYLFIYYYKSDTLATAPHLHAPLIPPANSAPDGFRDGSADPVV